MEKSKEFIQIDVIETKVCKNRNVRQVFKSTYYGTDLMLTLKNALGDTLKPEDIVLRMTSQGFARISKHCYDGEHEVNLHFKKVSNVEAPLINDVIQKLMISSSKS